MQEYISLLKHHLVTRRLCLYVLLVSAILVLLLLGWLYDSYSTLLNWIRGGKDYGAIATWGVFFLGLVVAALANISINKRAQLLARASVNLFTPPDGILVVKNQGQTPIEIVVAGSWSNRFTLDKLSEGSLKKIFDDAKSELTLHTLLTQTTLAAKDELRIPASSAGIPGAIWEADAIVRVASIVYKISGSYFVKSFGIYWATSVESRTEYLSSIKEYSEYKTLADTGVTVAAVSSTPSGVSHNQWVVFRLEEYEI